MDYLVERDLNLLIDYTQLNPASSSKQIKWLCQQVQLFKFNGICIPPYYIFYVKNLLKESTTKIISAISYPMGYKTTSAKVAAIKRACNDGVDELEVVANIAAIKNNDWNTVKNDIDTVHTICRMRNKVLRIVIEINLLESEELEQFCEIILLSKINALQITNGWDEFRLEIADIDHLKGLLGNNIQLKVLGTFRQPETIKKLLNSGVSKLGITPHNM